MALTKIKETGIADDAVTAGKIAAGAVVADITTGSVTATHLAGSIPLSKTNLTAGNGISLATDTVSVSSTLGHVTGVGTLSSLTTSGVVLGANGSDSAPSFSFSSDTNTGVYRVSADTLGITASGNRQVRFFDGDTYFDSRIYAHVGSVGNPSYCFNDDTDTGIYKVASNQIGIATNGTRRIKIDASGETAIEGTLITSGSATFAGTATAPTFRATSTLISADNMFIAGGQFYLGAENGSTDNTWRMYGYTGDFILQSRRSGTWATRFSLDGSDNATFAGKLYNSNRTNFGASSEDTSNGITTLWKDNNDVSLPTLYLRQYADSSTTPSPLATFYSDVNNNRRALLKIDGHGNPENASIWFVTRDNEWTMGAEHEGNFIISDESNGLGTSRLTIDSSGNTTFSSPVTFNDNINAPRIISSTGTTSIPYNDSYTIHTISNSAGAMWLINAYLANTDSPNNYHCIALLTAGNNVYRITHLQTANNLTLSLVGADVRAVQSSGGTQTVYKTITRLA